MLLQLELQDCISQLTEQYSAVELDLLLLGVFLLSSQLPRRLLSADHIVQILRESRPSAVRR